MASSGAPLSRWKTARRASIAGSPCVASQFPAKYRRKCWSGELQVGGGFLAALRHHVVADLLILIEAVEAGSLHGRDVDEHVLATALRHDETKTLCGIEPLDRTDRHSCLIPYQNRATSRGVAANRAV